MHYNVLLRDVPFKSKIDGPWAGVDAGLRGLEKAGIKPVKAYGDFDSVTASELENFKKQLSFDIVPSVKDYTDSELALLELAKSGAASIHVYGALGGRKDHELMNIHLLKHEQLRNLDIRLINETNEITLLTAGHHTVKKDSAAEYVSFIPLYDQTNLSLTGFKYDIADKYVSIGSTLTVSNEFKDDDAYIQTDKDILMIKSTD